MSEPIKIHPRTTEATAGALRVALLYAGFSGLWILLSDRAVEALIYDSATMTLVSILKGWVFVAVTAILLFVMVKRLVAGVANREAKLQTLIHAIPDLVWLKDGEGVYLGCNHAFEHFLGAKETDIIGRTDYDFAPKEQADFFRQKDREAMEAGETRVNEEWITLAGTEKRILVETLKTPIHDSEGALVGVLGIARDITEHRRLVTEQERLTSQLNQHQKMEAVGRFAGGVCHDYNNMLTVILANADLALHELPLEHPAHQRLQEITRAARLSAELTGQLLAFARQQPVNPRLLDFNHAIEGMLGLLTQLLGPEIRLVWKPGAAPSQILIDPGQLGQVLTNLVANARDALDGSGQIELATANRVLTTADRGTWLEIEPGDYVCLSVTDSGCGMAPDLVAQIFEPFFTTKPTGKGTGLGLATVHGVVKQNRGAIQVESEVGRGTSFRILFPRA